MQAISLNQRQVNMPALESREHVSTGCVVVSAVFFIVLSQVLLFYFLGSVSEFFRPLIVLVLFIQNWKRSTIATGPRIVAVLLMFHCSLITIVFMESTESLKYGFGIVLFLLMFFCVTGTDWNRREIRTIMMSCLVASALCAVILLAQNGPFDLSHDSIYFKFANGAVNRNRNAYAFALGTVIGVVFIRYDSFCSKPLILALTAICGYGVIYSQCRGAFLCAAIAAVILYFDFYKEIRKRNALLWFAFVIATIIVIAGGLYLLSHSAANRLLDTESQSGRDVANQVARDLYKNSDFFGQLFGHGFYFESRNSPLSFSAHNVYLTHLLAIGLYGCALYAVLFISCFRYIKGPVSYAFFFMAFCKTFVETLDYYTYIPLILSVIVYKCELEN